MVEHLFQEVTVNRDTEDDDDDGVVVPEIYCPLSDQKLAVLHGLINPLTSALNDWALYLQTLDVIQRLCSI